MASGPEGIDQATHAFRRLLFDASENEKARVDALIALSQRTVFLATWPGEVDDVRTLTNSDGETAMPIFSARDVLDSTGTKFGWRAPDGAMPHKEVGAREALRIAMERQVDFVVVDIGAGHATEFSRDEIEPVLARARRESAGPFAASGHMEAQVTEAVRRSTRPPQGAEGFAAAVPTGAIPKPAALPNLEMDDPFSNRTKPIRSERAAPRASHPATAPEGFARPPAAPATPAGEPETRPEGFSRPDDDAFPRADEVREMPSVPPTAPRSVRPPARSPTSPHQPSMPAASTVFGGGAESPAGAPPPTRARGPSAAPAPRRQPSAPAPNPVSASSARRSSAPAVAPAGNAAAQKMSAMLGADPKAPRSPSETGPPSAAPPAGSAPPPPDALHSLAVPLADELIDAISVVLRQYPEVEWAVEVSDAAGTPIVGLRVDPSFLTRISEISSAVSAASAKEGNEVQVLLLTDPDKMREARSAGTVFFPGRRRAVR